MSTIFPTPLPRTCLPTFPDPHLGRAIQDWKIQVVTSLIQARTNANLKHSASLVSMLSRHPTSVPMSSMNSLNITPERYTTPQNSIYDPATYTLIPRPVLAEDMSLSTGNSSGTGDHATFMDAATAAMKLTDTIVGGVTGSGTLGVIANLLS